LRRQGAKVAFIDIAEKPSRANLRRGWPDIGRHAPLFIHADLTDVERNQTGPWRTG
jgi:hypothetical protein